MILSYSSLFFIIIIIQEYYGEGPGGVSLSHLDHSHYHGVVEGDPDSHVYGSIRDGVFDGTIHTKDETLYVERSPRYFPNESSIHSVIYNDKHVRMPGEGGCSADADVRDWMEKVQVSAVEEEDEAEEAPSFMPGNPAALKQR